MVHLNPIDRLHLLRGVSPESQSQTPGRGATARPLHRPNPDLYGLPIGERLRFIAGIDHLLSLGPRIVTSFLLEASDDPIPELIRRLEDYRRLSPEVAAALGADDWTTPLRTRTAP